jgi:hypothetical protein
MGFMFDAGRVCLLGSTSTEDATAAVMAARSDGNILRAVGGNFLD